MGGRRVVGGGSGVGVVMMIDDLFCAFTLCLGGEGKGGGCREYIGIAHVRWLGLCKSSGGNGG